MAQPALRFGYSRSWRHFVAFAILAFLLSCGLGLGYYLSARHAFERSAKAEQQTVLQLIDAYVGEYSVHQTSDMPVPATFSRSAMQALAASRGNSEAMRIVWAGLPDRYITTPPPDADAARHLSMMARQATPKPRTRFVQIGGTTLLRTIYPSLATQECVTCHNDVQWHQASGAEHRWMLGDLMGAFILDAPVDAFMAARRNEGIGIAIVCFVVSVGLAFIFFRQNHRQMRSEAENRLFVEVAQAIEGIGDGLAVFDARGKMVLANKAYRRRNGGDPTIVFSEPVMKTTTIERDGSGSWVKVDEARTTSGMSVLLETDITALKRREGDLIAAKMAAESAGKARSDFLAMMSHELRTPLNAIIGFSEIMERGLHGPIASRYVEYAADIRNSGLHLLSIINDILDMSKIEAGKMQVMIESMNLLEAVEDCQRLFARQAHEKGVLLEVDIPDTDIKGDRLRFKQIIINLLSNAIKFTPAGGTVSVTATSNEQQIAIMVRDTGCGIAKADIPRILEPFVQIGDMHKTGRGGTGLGLPLTKALVELHGGTLTILSQLGSGTVVTVSLPHHSPTMELL